MIDDEHQELSDDQGKAENAAGDDFETAFAEFAVGGGAGESTDEDRTPASADHAPSTSNGEDVPADDPWARADERLRAEHDDLMRRHADLEHRYRSDEGRVGALQRRINQLTAELEGTKTKHPAPSSEDDGYWKELSEDFPEIAYAIEKKLQHERTAMLEKLREEVNGAVTPLRTAEEQRLLDREKSLLSTPVEDGGYGMPDWINVVRSNEFGEWLQEQPEQVRQLATSQAARDAAYLINLYKAMTGNHAASPTSGQAGAAGGRTGSPEEVNRIMERRARQLKEGAGVETARVVKKMNAVPDDFEAAFNVFAQKRTKGIVR